MPRVRSKANCSVSHLIASLYGINTEGTIMKYRKKPVEIEALKWTGKNQVEMFNFIYNGSNPDKAILSTKDKDFFISHCDCEGGLVIKTLEGRHIATIGDYIIKGVKGEFYPCKPAIFAMTYDAL